MTSIMAIAGMVAAVAYVLAFVCFAILIWRVYLR